MNFLVLYKIITIFNSMPLEKVHEDKAQFKFYLNSKKKQSIPYYFQLKMKFKQHEKWNTNTSYIAACNKEIHTIKSEFNQIYYSNINARLPVICDWLYSICTGVLLSFFVYFL